MLEVHILVMVVVTEVLQNFLCILAVVELEDILVMAVLAVVSMPRDVMVLAVAAVVVLAVAAVDTLAVAVAAA